ncbi:hypothetical protein AC249_AIPGENE26933 [Exaiptasia diaphana]|nr:hypothetical protein AC249_AIPGENE26933 [Exaiptasia diaphana]
MMDGKRVSYSKALELNPTRGYHGTHPNTHKTNISREERTALHHLSRLQDTVIKPADKGGSLVLWPVDMYTQEAHRQLSNTLHYQTIDYNPITGLVEEISYYLLELLRDNIIDKHTYEYLLPPSPPRTPLFYMLPKIHKPDIPGRPIISGCDSPTEKLSTFVDHFLKQLVPSIPSYIKDTNHFLHTVLNLNTPLPEGSLLVTIDVVSLYTNIPQDEGILASMEALGSLPYQSRPPLFVFQKFFEFILKRNYFSFNNQYYLQTFGTAMGTKMAPSFANIFLEKLERRFLSNTPSNGLQPLIWKRYIDDIFMIWTHGEETLNIFLEHLNAFHPNIKFQSSISATSINFLDTTIYITPDRRLESTIYIKPTDSSLLIHYTSHHPSKCKSGTIYSQALRLRRIITNNDELHKQLLRLRLILLSRGYPHHLINLNFQKILNLSQSQLLSLPPPIRNTEGVLPFVVPYHPILHKLPSILHNLWFLVSKDPELSTIFPQPPITAFSRHSNLKDTLVHTNFTT